MKTHLAKPSGGYDLSVQGSSGSTITDSRGKQYIDFIMGWCVGNLGWNNKEIKRAIKNFNGPAYVYPNFNYDRWQVLADKLIKIVPGNLAMCYRATGGSEAVDAAMQVAMTYTGRNKFVSVEGSYHGNTIATLSIGDSSGAKKLRSRLAGCLKLEAPLNEKAAGKLETLLKKKDVAAFIMEPVLCNLGVMIPTAEFMKQARALCTKYGTLLILDEVATGFGRTGKLFATEHFDIAPDIITISKAMSGGYAGIGAMLTTTKISGKVKDEVNIYSTYGWHPLATEAAIANVDYFEKHSGRIFSHVDSASQHFRTRLSQMDFAKQGEMNIIGLAISVKTKSAKVAAGMKEKAMKKGLLITAQEEKIVMFPPLNVSKSTIDTALDILQKCL